MPLANLRRDHLRVMRIGQREVPKQDEPMTFGPRETPKRSRVEHGKKTPAGSRREP